MLFYFGFVGYNEYIMTLMLKKNKKSWHLSCEMMVRWLQNRWIPTCSKIQRFWNHCISATTCIGAATIENSYSTHKHICVAAGPNKLKHPIYSFHDTKNFLSEIGWHWTLSIRMSRYYIDMTINNKNLHCIVVSYQVK